MTDRTAVIALDVGGTKIACGLFLPSGELLFEKTEPTGRESAEEPVRQIVALVDEAISRVPRNITVAGVGIVVPGWVNRSARTVWAPNVAGWDHIPLESLLGAQIPLPVVLDSDRSGYVKGEGWLGVARGLSDVVFLAVGTGIGAGILSGGVLVHGHDDLAGAVGWMALDPDFNDHYRTIGCFEAEAAGASVARKAAERFPARLTGGASEWLATDVFRAAEEGDPGAGQLTDETVLYLGMGIANLISVLNPQMIVLGGGLFREHSALLLEKLRKECARWAQPFAVERVKIAFSTLGTRAGLTGAARIAFDNFAA